MLTAVVAIMVLLLISGIFFSIINYQFKLETSEEKGLKAYYLAEAGINYGVALVRQDPQYYFDPDQPYLYPDKHRPNLPEDPLQAPDPTIYRVRDQGGQVAVPLSNPFGGNYLGVFDVYVRTYESTNQYTFTVTSIGYYPDQNGIRRTLRQQYTFPKPPGG